MNEDFDFFLGNSTNKKTKVVQLKDIIDKKNINTHPKKKKAKKAKKIVSGDKKNNLNENVNSKTSDVKNKYKKVKKTTVSFHQTEQDIIDKILKDLYNSNGVRGGFSDAIKIALRLCPLDKNSIIDAWNNARSEDGRILRHKK